jgi:hypothetical protein
MKLGLIYNEQGTNVLYRGLWASDALARKGHSIVLAPIRQNRPFNWAPLTTCDVVHVYRRVEPGVIACVDELRARGVGITWDIDDDCRVVPRESPNFREFGGLGGARFFALQTKMMRRADVVTTTTEYLAERFRGAHQTPVVAVDNYLDQSQFGRPSPHEGIVIGWVAGYEHRADVARLKLTELLREVMAKDPRIRVATLGVKLKLEPARYSFNPGVSMQELPGHISQFDIGIAPMADIPFNACRSAVKVKEYAAAGVPWLASGRGPYADLDSRHGGITLTDEQWLPALLALAASSEKREGLRQKGMAWAETQRMDRHIDKWYAVWRRAAAAAASRQVASA